jgi:hypothetical protein
MNHALRDFLIAVLLLILLLAAGLIYLDHSGLTFG